MKHFRKLLKYLDPYMKYAVLAPLFMVGEVMLDLAQPYLMQRIIDIGIKNSDKSFVLKTMALMFAFTILGALFGFGCIVYSSIASQNFGYDLRGSLFKKVQSFSYSNLDKLEVGHIITRLTQDTKQVQDFIMMMLRLAVRSPLLVIGSIIMSFATIPELAPILVFIIPALIAVIYTIMKNAFPLFKKVQEKIDAVNKIIQENLSGIRMIKSFSQEELEKTKFNFANIDLMNINTKSLRLIAVALPFVFLMINMGIVAIVWLGGIEYTRGNIETGQIVAFINYLLQLLFSLMIGGILLVNASRCEASSSRIDEILSEDPAISNESASVSTPPKKGSIEFQNVCFCYGSESCELALKHVSFRIEPGQKIAIMGATGSGKSTLLNMIPRLYDPTSGSIKIDGIDIKNYDLNALRSSIGFVHQKPILFSGSVKNNIMVGKLDAGESEISTACRNSLSDEFIDRFDDGYDFDLNQKGVNLSGGQKQRLSIARALVRKPKILIFDDSTSALDPQSEAELKRRLDESYEDTTLISVSQKISSVIDFDKILILDGGKIAGEGSHLELLAKNKIYKEIYRSQLGREMVR